MYSSPSICRVPLTSNGVLCYTRQESSCFPSLSLSDFLGQQSMWRWTCVLVSIQTIKHPRTTEPLSASTGHMHPFHIQQPTGPTKLSSIGLFSIRIFTNISLANQATEHRWLQRTGQEKWKREHKASRTKQKRGGRGSVDIQISINNNKTQTGREQQKDRFKNDLAGLSWIGHIKGSKGWHFLVLRW